MKPWEQKIVPMGFGLAGVLFIIAAVISAFDKLKFGIFSRSSLGFSLP